MGAFEPPAAPWRCPDAKYTVRKRTEGESGFVSGTPIRDNSRRKSFGNFHLGMVMEKKETAAEISSPSTSGLNRRTFLKAGGAALAASALAMPASSYARILGANDRIRLGQLGCGDRSGGHVHMVQTASPTIPAETVAVCDLWSLARERRAADVRQRFGQAPRQYKYSEEL